VPGGSPVAAFTGTPLSGNAPLDVKFTDSSTGTSITSRRWDFGDGNISTYAVSTNPSHRYTNAGTYSVNLTVTNVSGSNSLLRTNYISVTVPGGSPVAAFTGTPLSGNAPLDVKFTDSSTGTSITSRRWDFGDGNISTYAVSTNPSHHYTNAGTYSVNLTVTNASGSDYLLRPNYIGVTSNTQNATSGIAIFRNTSGYWYFDNNLDGIINKSFRFGGSTDQIIKGDWQGTGQDGIAIFRPASGFWYFDYNLDGIIDNSFRYGGTGDQIIAGDWQGTGSDGIAIFRPASGFWYFDYNLDGTVDNSFRYGGSTDRIIAGAWPGTAQDGIAIFRPASGYWYFDNNLDGIVDASFRFGGSADQIIAGAWSGTAQDGIAIFRPASGYWYFDNNLDGIVDASFRFGGSADQIIPGDWLGTGSDGIAIFRPASGFWYFDNNLDGIVDNSFRFGGSSDRILAGRWI